MRMAMWASFLVNWIVVLFTASHGEWHLAMAGAILAGVQFANLWKSTPKERE